MGEGYEARCLGGAGFSDRNALRRQVRPCLQGTGESRWYFLFSSLSLSISELSDTQVYEPQMRALLGNAARFCELDAHQSLRERKSEWVNERPRKALRGVISKVKFNQVCQLLTTVSHKMAPRTRQSEAGITPQRAFCGASRGLKHPA